MKLELHSSVGITPGVKIMSELPRLKKKCGYTLVSRAEWGLEHHLFKVSLAYM